MREQGVCVSCNSGMHDERKGYMFCRPGLYVYTTGQYTGAITCLLLLWAVSASGAWAGSELPDMERYFFSGNGVLTITSEQTKQSFSGVYRTKRGHYDKEAIRRICRVFNAPCESPRMELSLRLIEFLDYLEDHLQSGAKITITSGYRKPEYNTMLRNKGYLAAKASLHQYGMAADIKIAGVHPETLWHYVRNLHFGGTGYYHGQIVHIDVGPARSWDETTSGVGTGISDNNKLIGMVTDYDVYRPDMTVTLRFIRVTAFPIHVASSFSLLHQNSTGEFGAYQTFFPLFPLSSSGECTRFENIDEMNYITWRLPIDAPSGRYKIQARFCDVTWPGMPSHIETPEFEIKNPE